MGVRDFLRCQLGLATCVRASCDNLLGAIGCLPVLQRGRLATDSAAGAWHGASKRCLKRSRYWCAKGLFGGPQTKTQFAFAKRGRASLPSSPLFATRLRATGCAGADGGQVVRTPPYRDTAVG